MKSYQAPHEKLTKDQVKKQVQNLLNTLLSFKKRWHASDWQEHEFDEFIESQKETIFKLRRNFSPELTTIMEVSIVELSEMIRYPDESKSPKMPWD